MNQEHGSVKARANARTAYGHQAQVAKPIDYKSLTMMERLQEALTPPQQIIDNKWKILGLATAAGLVAGYIMGMKAFIPQDDQASDQAKELA